MNEIKFRWNFYDEISPRLLQGTILDVGAGYGRSQVLSKSGLAFIIADKQNRYVGLDPEDYERVPWLNIKHGDIRTWVPDRKFDTVLMIHSIEHIPFCDWKCVIDKLQSALEDDGLLIIGVPYREKRTKGHHEVFDINENTFIEFLPDAKIRSSRIIMCSSQRTRLLQRFVRYVLRFLRGKRRLPFGLSRRSIYVIWRKGNE